MNEKAEEIEGRGGRSGGCQHLSEWYLWGRQFLHSCRFSSWTSFRRPRAFLSRCHYRHRQYQGLGDKRKLNVLSKRRLISDIFHRVKYRQHGQGDVKTASRSQLLLGKSYLFLRRRLRDEVILYAFSAMFGHDSKLSMWSIFNFLSFSRVGKGFTFLNLISNALKLKVAIRINILLLLFIKTGKW